LIKFGKKCRRGTHHDGADLLVDKAGKDWFNLGVGRYVDNLQA
jgi:hypothetical protein